MKFSSEYFKMVDVDFAILEWFLIRWAVDEFLLVV
jgi:hypothetical protein